MTVIAPAKQPVTSFSSVSLARLRRRLWDRPPGCLLKIGRYRLRITDGPNAYMQFKDVFVRGIYRFTRDRPDPLIIDGGSNMGISVLGFKHDHPDCRVIAFEPDPALCRLLAENLRRNDVTEGVTLNEAGLGDENATVSFAADGSAGGKVVDGVAGQTVKVQRLSSYLNDPVDFLKLNIEGAELTVLQECARAGVLRNVRKMVVEYHGWPDSPQTLGDLLNLLDGQRFRYLVHDFDPETCSITKPPFRLRPRAPWFCLVHAQRP